MKDIGRQTPAKVHVVEEDSAPPSVLEKVLKRDLDAWREAKAAIEKAKG